MFIFRLQTQLLDCSTAIIQICFPNSAFAPTKISLVTSSPSASVTSRLLIKTYQVAEIEEHVPEFSSIERSNEPFLRRMLLCSKNSTMLAYGAPPKVIKRSLSLHQSRIQTFHVLIHIWMPYEATATPALYTWCKRHEQHKSATT